MTASAATRRGQPDAAPSNASAAVATRAGRALGLTPTGGATTPRRLGLARLILVGIAFLLGAGSVAFSVQLDNQQSLAQVHATQLVRATGIETQLLSAQAAAARASLTGASDQVDAVHAALNQAGTQLVEIATEKTDSSDSLAQISISMLRYAEALERAQLQRGTKEGRSTLAAADKLLRNDLLPAVQALETAHSAVTASPVTWWMWLVPALAWVSVAALLAVSWYTARVSHRVVNLGLAAATAATVVMAVTAGATLVNHAAATVGSVSDQFGRLAQLTASQRSAADAFSRLATGVATQQWTPSDQKAFDEALKTAKTNLDSQANPKSASKLDRFGDAAAATLKAATAANWPAAEAELTTATGTPPTTAALDYLTEVGNSVDVAKANLEDAVSAQTARTIGFGALAVSCALAAAVASALGLRQRLKEYR